MAENSFNIIYADPPWSFSSKELQKYGPDQKRFSSIEKHYQVQGTDWIKSLGVEGISAEDAALFLWTTDAHMLDALEVIKAWGFAYKTVAFVWEKMTSTGKTYSTLGAWTMKNYELCLFATKGTMLKYKKSNSVKQKIAEQRTVHSRKPEKARANIEEMFGDLPRIELFARQRFPGWEAWGNEVDYPESLGRLIEPLREV